MTSAQASYVSSWICCILSFLLILATEVIEIKIKPTRIKLQPSNTESIQKMQMAW